MPIPRKPGFSRRFPRYWRIVSPDQEKSHHGDAPCRAVLVRQCENRKLILLTAFEDRVGVELPTDIVVT